MTARCRLDLPRDGAAIVAWVNPLAWWGDRVAGAIAARRPLNDWRRARASRST
jgi:hypothetical protein